MWYGVYCRSLNRRQYIWSTQNAKLLWGINFSDERFSLLPLNQLTAQTCRAQSSRRRPLYSQTTNGWSWREILHQQLCGTEHGQAVGRIDYRQENTAVQKVRAIKAAVDSRTKQYVRKLLLFLTRHNRPSSLLRRLALSCNIVLCWLETVARMRYRYGTETSELLKSTAGDDSEKTIEAVPMRITKYRVDFDSNTSIYMWSNYVFNQMFRAWVFVAYGHDMWRIRRSRWVEMNPWIFFKS